MKERLSIYGKIDEDTFHNAYLTAGKQIMLSGVGIEDPESCPFGCYRRILQSGARNRSRYNSPGDEYFARLDETDCTGETEEREEMLTGCGGLVGGIQRLLGRHFSYEDYRIFMLRFYETGNSFRTIVRRMGEKISTVARRAQAMMESVRANRKFITRRRLIMAGETA